MFPQYLLALPPKESVMLMYLIDQEAYIEQRLADEPEYFRCCQENYIKNYFIGWSSNLISTAIDSLCKSGYIYKKIIRIEGKKNTFIKLNYDAIYELKSNYEKQLTENRSNYMVRFINSDDLEEEYENLTGRPKDFNKPFYYLEQQEMELLASIDYVSNTIQKDEYGFFKCNPDFLQFYFKPCLTENEIVNSVKELTMLGYLEHEYIGADLYIMVTDKAHEEMYNYTLNCIKEEK